MTLGERIRATRLKRGMSQVDLAESIGMTQQALGSLEKGRTKSTAKLMAIARILSVSPGWLEMGDEEGVSSNIVLSDQEAHLVSKFRSLNGEDREVILRVVSSLNQTTFGENDA